MTRRKPKPLTHRNSTTPIDIGRGRPEVIVEFLFERGMLHISVNNIGDRPAIGVRDQTNAADDDGFYFLAISKGLAMRKTFGLLAVALIALGAGGFVTAQKRGGGKRSGPAIIRETTPANPISAPAPAECSALVRALVAYVSREKPDIAGDPVAQNRWLSKSLREALAHRLKSYEEYAKKNPDSPEGPPSNSDFVGSWDYPTTYSIVGSRLQDQHAVVDAVFTWGPKTQYPGDKRLTSYVFVREGGAWKLDDIYTFRGEFVEASSLVATFSRDEYP